MNAPRSNAALVMGANRTNEKRMDEFLNLKEVIATLVTAVADLKDRVAELEARD